MRYLLFAFPVCCPLGGIDDLVGSGSDREKMMDAIREKLESGRRFQLVDLKTGKTETFIETFVDDFIQVRETNCYDGFSDYRGVSEAA